LRVSAKDFDAGEENVYCELYLVVAKLLFLCGLALLSYLIGIGLKQEQRSCIALGMGTRNIAAVFAVLMAIPNPGPRLVVMIVLVVPLSAIVAFVAAWLFATRAGGTVVERAA
jgi:hypothetical protein